MINKGFCLAQVGVAVTDGPSQDPSDHIPALCIRRQLSFGNRERDGPHMVGNNPHGNICFFIVAVADPGK